MSDGWCQIEGLVGHAQVGKDTVAGIAMETVKPSLLFGHAYPMKYVFADWLGISVREVDALKVHIEMRRALQITGTEVGRDLLSALIPKSEGWGENALWIRYLYRKMTPRLKEGCHIIIPDVRFENEADAIHEWGGKLTRVTRPENEKALKGAAAAHASESEIDKIQCDREIVNDGTPDDLRAKVREALGIPAKEVQS